MADRESLEATMAQAEKTKALLVATLEKLPAIAKDPDTKAWLETSIRTLQDCIDGCKLALAMGDVAFQKPGTT